MPTCRVWPDGTFGLSNVERKMQLEVFNEQREPSTHEAFIAKQIEVYGVEAVIAACVETRDWHSNLLGLSEETEQDNMDLTNVPNSLRAKRGQKGISTYGRLLVRNACFLMEKSNALDTVTFLTTTLPTMEVDSNRFIVENWHKVVKNFTLRLTRKLKAEGLSGEIVGVTEVQEGRLSVQSNLVGLHLHLLFVGRKAYKPWAVSTIDVQDYWKDALSSVAPSLARECNFDYSTNMQRLKKSGAAYIGKYLSKGSAVVSRLKALNPTLDLPACWYTCTMTLREKVKRLQVYGRRPAMKINEWIDTGQTQYFHTIRTITIPLDDGTELAVGWAGKLTERGRNALSLPFTPNGSPRLKRLFPEGL